MYRDGHLVIEGEVCQDDVVPRAVRKDPTQIDIMIHIHIYISIYLYIYLYIYI